jgi:hypothetical protein
METRVILRFRDLVTEEGGTIEEHLAIIKSQGEVWWGWWMRQYETPPRDLFAALLSKIGDEGNVSAYLFNTGEGRLFSCSITDIKVAPPGTKIGPLDPERTPEYYARGRYPAWFRLSSLEEVRLEDHKLVYESFPSRPELQGTYSQLIDQPIKSLDDLRQIDVTIWVVGDYGPKT